MTIAARRRAYRHRPCPTSKRRSILVRKRTPCIGPMAWPTAWASFQPGGAEAAQFAVDDIAGPMQRLRRRDRRGTRPYGHRSAFGQRNRRRWSSGRRHQPRDGHRHHAHLGLIQQRHAPNRTRRRLPLLRLCATASRSSRLIPRITPSRATLAMPPRAWRGRLLSRGQPQCASPVASASPRQPDVDLITRPLKPSATATCFVHRRGDPHHPRQAKSASYLGRSRRARGSVARRSSTCCRTSCGGPDNAIRRAADFRGRGLTRCRRARSSSPPSSRGSRATSFSASASRRRWSPKPRTRRPSRTSGILRRKKADWMMPMRILLGEGPARAAQSPD